jgi:hypothetical protein
MGYETVFYFDVLGFRHLASGTARAAIDVFSTLTELLQRPTMVQQTQQWSHRYSLSDSVFLTHPDPVSALKQARDLVFNLVRLNVARNAPVLVRGALACGEVHHVKGIFLTSDEPANLVGEPIVEAVMLEHGSGLKGPRILLSEEFVQTITAADRALAEWQLRPTAMPGVWEVLWFLPASPAEFPRQEPAIRDVCRLALSLLKARGGHPEYGAQYRAFVVLAARCIERVKKFVHNGKIAPTPTLSTLMTTTVIAEVCDITSGLPDEYVTELLRLVDSIGR